MAFFQELTAMMLYWAFFPLILTLTIINAIYRFVFPVRLPIPKNILITGASRGLGKELAVQYAKMTNGNVSLHLTARTKESLNETRLECEKFGAHVNVYAAHVEDQEEMNKTLANIQRDGPLDLVIANAGTTFGEIGDAPLVEKMHTLFDINANGVFNTIFPVIERMRERGQGQIAIVSSLVSYTSIPTFGSQSSSKAAVRVEGESLMNLLKCDNVSVNVICPGFVYGPEANPGLWKWVMIDRESAVKRIIQGLARNEPVITFPFFMSVFINFISMLPTSARLAVFALLTFGVRPLGSKIESAKSALKEGISSFAENAPRRGNKGNKGKAK
jgi:short-subunit dehydrogenase